MNEVHVGALLGKGAEHHVYEVDASMHPREGRQVAKVPHTIGVWWQDMEATLAESDLDLLERYEIPVIETTVVKPELMTGALVDPAIVHEDFTREEVHYILLQPFIEDLRPIALSDLEDADVLDQIRDIWEKADQLYKDHSRGVDFAGMDALLNVTRNFFKAKIDVAISNLHLREDGVVELLDTRLFSLQGKKASMNLYLRLLTELQLELLALLIRERDSHVEPRLFTKWNMVPKVMARFMLWALGSRRP